MWAETRSEGGSSRDGLYVYGVTRPPARQSWSGLDRPLTTVRYQDLVALVRPVPFAAPGRGRDEAADHQRVMDSVMRQTTVLPLPFGLVFRGRRALLRFLEDQYVALGEGLDFLDGHWEMRLHITGETDSEAAQATATQLYTDLRSLGRAALPLPAAEGRLLSAAFLVDRGGWIRFVEEVDDLGLAHPELSLDVTGPWPPYDFVAVDL